MYKTDSSLNGMEIMSFFSVSSGTHIVSRKLKGTGNSPGEQSWSFIIRLEFDSSRHMYIGRESVQIICECDVACKSFQIQHAGTIIMPNNSDRKR